MSSETTYVVKHGKKTVREERTWICDKCGKTFKSASARKQHMFSHSKIRPFECDICRKTFKRIHHLQEHAVSHSDERPFGCDKCGKRYKDKRTLRNHLLGRSGIACDPNFVQFSKVRSRKKPSNHPRRKKTFPLNGLVRERSFYCDHCGNGFSHKSELQAHIISHHHKERQLIGNIVRSTQHHPNRKIPEEECNERKAARKKTLPSITYKSSFLEKIREEEYVATCPACLRSFKRHALLIQHVKECEWYAALLRQERKKLEAVPEKCEYECSRCRLSFDKAPLLHDHLKKEHNVKFIFHWCVKYGCEESW